MNYPSKGQLNNIMMSAFYNDLARLQDQNARISGGLTGLGPDYDYRMAGELDARGHSGDLGKLPNHPTFSNLSAYATPQTPGGEWGEDFMGPKFTPSSRMWNQPGYRDYIRGYMQDREPDVRLFRPIGR